MSRGKRSKGQFFSFSAYHYVLFVIAVVLVAIVTYVLFFYNVTHYERAVAAVDSLVSKPLAPTLNKDDYNKRMLALSHINIASTTLDAAVATSTASSTILLRRESASTSVSVQGKLWPKASVYPQYGAILPFKRDVAYYGNFYSKGMGILGEYDEATVLAKLKSTVAEWEAADPNTPVVPAIEYIDVTAQGAAGKDGKYRARMSDSQIDKALDMAHQVNGIVVLDIQIGLSTVQDEVPLIDTYLAKPDVHLALVPEFALYGGHPPGTVIGTMDASTIYWTIQHLSKIVDDNHLPPKILLLHRFTTDMLTNVESIHPTPEVQVVIQMDGWG